MKRLKAVILSLMLTLMACVVPIQANAADLDNIVVGEIAPAYIDVNVATSILSISGTTATCKSQVKCTNATSITVSQCLYKVSGDTLIPVPDAQWSTVKKSTSVTFTNTKSGLGSGTYRLETVFTVYVGRVSESVTVYSNDVTI